MGSVPPSHNKELKINSWPSCLHEGPILFLLQLLESPPGPLVHTYLPPAPMSPTGPGNSLKTV